MYPLFILIHTQSDEADAAWTAPRGISLSQYLSLREEGWQRQKRIKEKLFYTTENNTEIKKGFTLKRNACAYEIIK